MPKGLTVVLNESIPAGDPITLKATRQISSSVIRVGLDIMMTNGATPPTTPMLLTISWRRALGGPLVTQNITGPVDSNGILPLLDFPIPSEIYEYTISTTGAVGQATDIYIGEGTFTP